MKEMSELDKHALVENAYEYNKSSFLVCLATLFICIVFVASFALKLYFSDEATVVMMPHSVSTKPSYTLSSPANSSSISANSSVQRFVRDLIILMAPRNEEDTSIFYEKLLDYTSSTGDANRLVRGIIANMKDQKQAIASGTFNRIYRSKLPGSYRVSSDGGYIIAEADLIVVQQGKTETRLTPSCRFEMEPGDRNMTNEYGLYLIRVECQQLMDATSGETVPVQLLGGYSDK